MRKFKIDYSFIVVIILIILSPKQIILLKLLLCLFVHEVGHIFVCYLFNIKINKLTLFGTGFMMDINNDDLLFYQSILLYFGGIFFNILLYLVNIDKDISMISIILAIINLVPVYPLDGHQIIKSILEYFIPIYKVYIISIIISVVSLCIIFIISIVYKVDLFLFFNYLYLLILICKLYKNRKIYYQQIILHRYLKNNYKKKEKIINVYNNHIYYLYRYHYVIFFDNFSLIEEKNVIKHYFKN